MEGLRDLDKITHPVVFDVDGNKIIERLNAIGKLRVTTKPEGLFATASFKLGENGAELILEFNTVTVVACDESGNQMTLVLPAYQPGNDA